MNRKHKGPQCMALMVIFLIGAALLSSCQMYQSNFDCPPGVGIPCTSVTDIESMVIETDKGPDVLAGKETGAWRHLVKPVPPGKTQKVWIAAIDTDDGCHVDGHYIHLLSKED